MYIKYREKFITGLILGFQKKNFHSTDLSGLFTMLQEVGGDQTAN